MDKNTNPPRPDRLPARPHFSSGPTVKRPGWQPEALAAAVLGRNHRSDAGFARIRTCHAMMRENLSLPDEYRIAMVPGSDTGAMEMAMWSLLGAPGIGVDVFAFDVFGQRWLTDVRALGIDDLREFKTPYGTLPDFTQYDASRDCVLTWNATAAGVIIPDGNWIPAARAHAKTKDKDEHGLVIVDATSAVFAVDLPWADLDVVTFSWQKALGGEAAHGVIVLSPRAVRRLETFTPPRPLPRLFTMTTAEGKLNEAIFDGATINTPSLLCVEDAIDALEWIASIGGLGGAVARTQKNFRILADWVEGNADFTFLARDPATISPVSVCLRLTEAGMARLGIDPTASDSEAAARAALTALATRLEAEGAALDIIGHSAAPPVLRIWCGPTIEADDLTALLPWIEWGMESAVAEAARQARACP